MGIITKKQDDKKSKGIMVRLPSNVSKLVDMFVGNTHSSRPDLITDATRQYLLHVSYHETEAMLKIENKEVSHEAKRTFYLEYMTLQLGREKKAYESAHEKSKGKDVDVLLSLPPGLLREINGAVDRTQFYKNHQEFLKLSIMHFVFVMATYNTNTLLTTNFLQDPEDLKKLKKELDDLRSEINKENI